MLTTMLASRTFTTCPTILFPFLVNSIKSPTLAIFSIDNLSIHLIKWNDIVKEGTCLFFIIQGVYFDKKINMNLSSSITYERIEVNMNDSSSFWTC